MKKNAKGPCKLCTHYTKKDCIGNQVWCQAFSKYTIRQLKQDKADMRKAMIEHCKKCEHFSNWTCIDGPDNCQLYPYIISQLCSK